MFSIDPEAELQRLQLNYGYIERGTVQGRFNLSYNAPGISVSGQNLFLYQIENQRLLILATGNRNVSYLQQYIDAIDAGKCVGECVNSKYFMMDTCNSVKDGCDLFQGGFIKYWTRNEIIDAQGPYLREIEDSNAIESYIGYVPPPPTSFTVQIMAPIGVGTVTPTPKIYTFSNTECFNISAVAGLGWHFSYWNINGAKNYNAVVNNICYDAGGYVIQAVFTKDSDGGGDGNGGGGAVDTTTLIKIIAVGSVAALASYSLFRYALRK